MCRRKCRQSCPRRLECETGRAQGERGGSWWPPSEDADRALFDIWSVAVDEALAGGVADLHAGKGVLQDRVGAQERVEAKPAAGCLIDKHVDIGVLAAFLASVGAKKIQRRNAVSTQLGFNGLKLVDDFSTVHGFGLYHESHEAATGRTAATCAIQLRSALSFTEWFTLPLPP